MRFINFLNEKKTKFSTINDWKSDLRRLTKIYKDIDSEGKFNEAQKIFTTFSTNFENWVFKELLKNDEGTSIQKEVRTKGWQAAIYMGTSDLFPTSWYYKTNKHHPDLEVLKKNRQKRIDKYNRLFREFFKTAEEYFEVDYMQDISPREHTINKFGINFVISKDAPRDEYLKQYLNIYLPKQIEALNRRGFKKSYKDATVIIERTLGKYGGTYNKDNDIIKLSTWALFSKGKTLIHEIGHRVYFNLPSSAIKVWDSTVHGLTDEITREDFKNFFNRYQSDIYKFYDEYVTHPIKELNLGKIDDLVQRYKFEYIKKRLNTITLLSVDNKEDIFKHYKKFVVGERMHLGFDIDSYATTNTWEGFAEAFAFYVVEPTKLNWFIRTLLINTLRAGGYRLNEGEINMNVIDKIDNYLNERKSKIPDYSELGLKASKFDVSNRDMGRASTIGVISYLMPTFEKMNIAPLPGANKFDILVMGDEIVVKWTTAGKKTLRVRSESDPSYFNDVLKVFKVAFKNYFTKLKK